MSDEQLNFDGPPVEKTEKAKTITKKKAVVNTTPHWLQALQEMLAEFDKQHETAQQKGKKK